MLQESDTKIQLMEYRRMGAVSCPSTSSGLEAGANDLATGSLDGDRSMLAARIQEMERQAVEREHGVSRQLEEVRAKALEQARTQQESVRVGACRSAAAQMQQVLERFVEERDRYLSQVEQEVVRLALGIAARILRREAQMDPLLLSGAVRVALGQLAKGTEVKLRVPAGEKDLWEEMLRLMPNLPLRPELIADASLGAENCSLETNLGVIDLGVRAQLKEIERGFFDLLDRRSRSPENDAPRREAGRDGAGQNG